MAQRIKTSKQGLTRRGKYIALALALAEFATAYGFLSLAINSGSLWQYASAALLVVLGGRSFIEFVKALHSGRHHRQTAKT
ncbi:MAG TPA: hypothetical protein VLH86_01035 [Patescibacteria group bacterium]|nr:hypothetical protein [Patescibacteria group bacterium]